jgi:hypothetical protein
MTRDPERKFGSALARSAMFRKLSAYLASKDGPHLIASITTGALGLRFNNPDMRDRDVISVALRNCGWELYRPYWRPRLGSDQRAAA